VLGSLLYIQFGPNINYYYLFGHNFFLGLIMPLVPIFVAKFQFGSFIFFISIWSLFWKFDLNNVVISVSGIVTTLNVVPRVSSSIF